MKFTKRVFLFFYILLGAVFLPVLFCVLFIDNHMNYNEGLKLEKLLPNYALLLIALIGLVGICLLTWAVRGIRMTAKVNLILNGALAAAFLLLFFINLRVTKEIAFILPWDVEVVGAEAENAAAGIPMGYSVYMSVYSNNIPIVYILKTLYNKAAAMDGYVHVYEFIWLEVNCALISIGGFLCCLVVKKLTKALVPTMLAFLMYLALAGISPWKIAPYTDTYGIVFPVMAVYFYVCYRDAEGIIKKCLLLALAMLSGAVGGLIKPSVYLVIIAILSVELVRLQREYRGWIFMGAGVMLALILFLGKEAYIDYMMDDMGLEFNPEIEASWQSYFYMGLNEENTGSYHADDVKIYGEFQTDKSARNEAALERAFARMEKRGVLGSLYYWLRKMTMVFNDGTFGWRGEVWIKREYPEKLASDSRLTELLRDIFWPGGALMGQYNTVSQQVWIFCLVGIIGICFCFKEQRERYAVLVVSFLGIFFYQMLFEARARYLFVFFPLLTAMAACGIWQYAEWTAAWWQKRKDRTGIPNTDGSRNA